MVFQPNYRFKKAQRQRVKQTRRDEQSPDAEARAAEEPDLLPGERDAQAEQESERSERA